MRTLRMRWPGVSEPSVVVLVVLLLDVPRAPRRLDPVVEEALHELGLLRVAFVVHAHPGLLPCLPGVVLHQRPLRVAGEVCPLPEIHAWMKADDRQGARVLPRGVVPGEVRVPAPVVLDEAEELEEAHGPELLVRRLLPRQVPPRAGPIVLLRALAPEPVVRAALIQLEVGFAVNALRPSPILPQ